MASPFPSAADPEQASKRRIVHKDGLLFKTQRPPIGDASSAAVSSSGNVMPEILPREGEPNVLVTSALPYVNNVPHLGNIIGSTLSADVYARYSRSRGRNTLYICGTDEYGTATETKALEEKVSPQALCDKYHALHRQVYNWFGIGFDHFGRTTTPKQTTIAQDIFLKLHKNGYLEKRSMTQLYCEKDQRFLADRYVEGTCPKCGYDDARGDQCDGCGQLLDAVELIKPHCKLCSSAPIQKESSHLFLKIDDLQPATEKWAREAAEVGAWSANGRHITESWFKEGLRPFSLTRDLKWGVPVPVEGMEGKVLYVWFDAPIGYPSITANYTEHWEQWWRNPEQVKLYQFMGKDNTRFHTVIFPSCLLGTQEPWTMLHHVSTTEYLNYEGGKFSKSRNIGVFGDKAGEIGVPNSVWRYYLLSNRPEGGDTQFSWHEFVLRNNSELLANIGNFVNRVLTFLSKKYDGILPEVPEGLGLRAGPEHLEQAPPASTSESAQEAGLLFPRIARDVNDLLAQYTQAMDAVKLRQGLHVMMALSSRGNQFLVEAGLDNSLYANKKAECDATMLVAVNFIWTLSSLIHPFMPDTADQICTQLNAPPRLVPVEDVTGAEVLSPTAADFSEARASGDKSAGSKAPRSFFALDLLPGHQIGKPAHLFRRIDEKKEEEWRVQFGGATAKNAAEGASEGGPQISKKQAAKAAKAAKKAANPTAERKLKNPTKEWEELDQKVKAQGEVVRKAKEAAKSADASTTQANVDGEVSNLLRLRNELNLLTDKLAALEVASEAASLVEQVVKST
ncbi:hypothetical protein IE81DRAFT_336127 [Ceraceosorus guamensis]|uniref:methionine--tRNA ligase n=1 Tax=Ceraceosorus guamensis TaxID=1522189 RepID=A0A316W7X4_9BASI|nr:hypothetical protein IE81DRAFT_336127 [Ceraceosorus guamensis]PWN45969.1 hypothetical protein IE81DRAFT_336127 [Ceraceosorus guamensis]